MYNGLSHYLQTNNILVPEQFGFRKGISTENAAFKLTDGVLKSLNQKMHVGGIFCDLAKAFDCVNHEIKSPYATQSIYSNWGNNRAWSSTGVNFRAFAFHNLYK
jgi:hypothetical protein